MKSAEFQQDFQKIFFKWFLWWGIWCLLGSGKKLINITVDLVCYVIYSSFTIYACKKWACVIGAHFMYFWVKCMSFCGEFFFKCTGRFYTVRTLLYVMYGQKTKLLFSLIKSLRILVSPLGVAQLVSFRHSKNNKDFISVILRRSRSFSKACLDHWEKNNSNFPWIVFFEVYHHGAPIGALILSDNIFCIFSGITVPLWLCIVTVAYMGSELPLSFFNLSSRELSFSVSSFCISVWKICVFLCSSGCEM